MKKSERKTEIKKRAYQYAKTGDHINWLSIEHTLRSIDGFSEARTELDDRFVRQEIDTLCNMATSSEESSRRKEFSQWIDQIIEKIAPQISSRGLILRRLSTDDAIFVEGPTYSLVIRRRFGCSKLESAKSVDSGTSTRYGFDFESVHLDKDFDAFTEEDTVELIVMLGNKANSVVRRI
jgi:hypothetical protein